MAADQAIADRPAMAVSRSTAADQIADDLREQIVSGAIARGSKLPTERELCGTYGVSAITVRAALRSLATMNLIEVRHGIGSFVTLETDALVGTALRSLIQIDRITAPEILAVLGTLNGFAAELAAGSRNDADLTAMEVALDSVELGTSIPEVTAALTDFLDALARASGNPLLESLCRFLGGLQISLARELADESFDRWQAQTAHLQPLRRHILEAVRARDAGAARAAAVAYHAATTSMIAGLPNRSQTLSPGRRKSFLASVIASSISSSPEWS